MFWEAAASLLFALTAYAHAVEIRLATYNIGAHFTTNSSGVYYPDYSLGVPGTPDFDSVRDILQRIDADVVALEEIHAVDISGNSVNTLAANLGYPYIYIAPSANTFDNALHVAFLSRFPFLTQTAINSPSGAKEMNRLIPAVKVDVPGTTRDPVLLAAHLKSGSAAADLFQRTVEMRRLTGYLATSGFTPNDNFIIMGDFNLSASDRTFTSLPASGLPASFVLGSDITLPINYSINPVTYFNNPAVTRIIPRQLDNSIVTFPSSGSTLDLFLVSPLVGARPLHTEIYNSTLDTSNTSGLAKAGSPLAVGTSTAASDHLALFGDFELDPALPYAFHTPGATISETFTGFSGTYDPYPWVTTGGIWQGTDSGESTATGFRAYGTVSDRSLGLLPATTGGSATASFVNQSTQMLSTLQISFTAEQWRSSLVGTVGTLTAELIVGGVPQPLPQLTFHAATNLPNGAIAGGVSTPESITVSGLSIAPGALFQLKFTFTPGSGSGPRSSDVFVNEFHYDNASTDEGEFMEVVVSPGFTGNLTDIDVLLYRGVGTVYSTLNVGTLPFTLKNTVGGFKILAVDFAPNGIQNGPSGIAVVNKTTNQLLHFLSYEGVVTATTGLPPVAFATSTDIGVSQNSETVGYAALGLTGTGSMRTDFTWAKIPGLYSKGSSNAGQTFAIPSLPPQGIAIDNLAVTFVADSDGDGFTDADEAVFGTNPLDANSHFTMSFTLPSAGIARLIFPTLTGRSYTVESSVDLTTWSDIATYSGTNFIVDMDISLAVGEAKKFYRIRAKTP